MLPPESLTKFPRTCKSQKVAQAKPSCGFCALNPCGTASLTPPLLPERISAGTHHQQAQSSLGSTLHGHRLSSYVQILPATCSALGPPSQHGIHRAHGWLQGEKPQIGVGERSREEGRMDEGGGEERREGNNLLSQGKRLKLGQILHWREEENEMQSLLEKRDIGSCRIFKARMHARHSEQQQQRTHQTPT